MKQNKTLNLQTVFDQARALDTAQRSSETYNNFSTAASAVKDSSIQQSKQQEPISNAQGDYYFPGNKCQDFAGRYVASTSQSIKCFFCGNKVHPEHFARLGRLSVINVKRKDIFKESVNLQL